jgi:hypothetical protein
VTATIVLPTGLTLASGGSTIPITPDPLPVGQTASAVWSVLAQTQTVAMTFPYTVRLEWTGGYLAECRSAVRVPPIGRKPPCIPSGISTRGTDFWTCFPPNDGGSTPKELTLFIAASEDSRVRISRPFHGTTNDITVSQGSFTSFIVESDMDDATPEFIADKGIHITSDKPVSVYSGSLTGRHSDASIVIPTHALGMKYVTAGYNYTDPEEHFMILATEDATSVTINPFSMTSTGRPTRVPFTVQLNQGETYYVKARVLGAFGGLTGTLIESDKPVAVISGAYTGWIPDNPRVHGYLNPHYDQIIPDELLGTEYITVPFRSRLGGDTFKAVATQDSTEVTIGNDPPVSLAQRGDPYEFPLTEATRIVSNRPILLTQFANSATWDIIGPQSEYGDASMVVLNATDRFSNCHEFPSPSGETENYVLDVEPQQWLQVENNWWIENPVFTAECWVKAKNRMVIVSRDRPGNALPDWSMVYEYTQHRIEFMTGMNSQLDEYYWSPPHSLDSGRWNHVALVVNGPAGTAKVYINGTLSLDTVFAPRNFTVDAGLAWNGYYDNPGGAGGRGSLDECRYWNYERSEAQIRANMNSRLPDSDRLGLVGYWSFCSSAADDSSSRSNVTVLRGQPSISKSTELPATLHCELSTRFPDAFVNVVVPDGGQDQVSYNGTLLPDTTFHVVPNSTFLCAQLKLSRGAATTVETQDQRGVGAIVYGFEYHDAYTYNSGFQTWRRTSLTGVSDEAGPSDFRLVGVHPNPFISTATVTYRVAEASRVELALYDALGRKAATLVDDWRGPGEHSVYIHGSGLPSGAYTLVYRYPGGLRKATIVVAR